ncbi:FSD1-like protein isoform X3 [Gambusia affinis]|uniref:FSD1-like protein isoform X3 n=1 Tax=Gambusia affinis TaxID=33528 RepID=UPI001CDD725F|nr:FSD1-like protein isoform X3 [Gambusia affinis]
MDTQKEALRRIINTLANKNEELQHFLDSVDGTRTGLQEESCKVMSELEAELEKLSSALEERGAQLRDIIKEEKRRKEAELQRQLSEGKAALLSCQELLEFANQSLTITNEEEFLTPSRSKSVPRAPEIDVSSCVVRDNSITVAWRPSDGDGPIERYDLEHRKANRGGALRAVGESSWEKISDITDTQVTLSGLKFDSPFIVVRVRARNKTAAGDFSEPVAMETKAFTFGFDAATAHAELKIQGDTVTWEPQGVKGHDARLRGKENKNSSRNATPSPNKTAGSRGGRERFAGESYTVLGDQEINGGCHYWELRPLADWKSFSVGVAYRGSLGRFDQLGKSSGSWCLYASQWLQSALAAKHGNRAKALDWPLPQRIGIYCDHDNGELMFIDVNRLRLLHVFRNRFLQPLVPAFTVWCGGISVATGLQVPSFMGNFVSSNHSAAADQSL